MPQELNVDENFKILLQGEKIPVWVIKDVKSIKDITKQLYEKNLELLEQRRRTDQLLYHISEIVIAIDTDYKITLFNKVMQSSLGLKNPEEITGRDIEGIIKLETKNGKPLNIKDYCFPQNRGDMRVDGIVLITPREKRYVNLATTTIVYQTNKKECLVTLTDVTREKKLDLMKDDFISVAAHELRTPMTIIKGYLWLLLQEKGGILTPKQKSYLDVTIQNTERMTNLVNDMLNISRMERGKVEFKVEKINICTEITEIANSLKVRADQSNIYLKVICPESIIQVMADKVKFNEVMLNLVGNALKFTKIGGITIKVEKAHSFVKVSVIDTGVGIDREDQGRLFQKFGRLDSSYKTVAEAGGTGLGLYITKQYVERMGGIIGFISEGVGKGSTFWFTLPTSA